MILNSYLCGTLRCPLRLIILAKKHKNIEGDNIYTQKTDGKDSFRR